MPNNLDPDDITRLTEGLRDLTDAISAQSATLKTGIQTSNLFNTSLKSSSTEAKNVMQVYRKATEDFGKQMRQSGMVYDKASKEWVSAKEKERKLLSASQRAVYDQIQATRMQKLREVQRTKLYETELQNLGYSKDANGKLIKTSIELTQAQKDEIKSLKKHEAAVAEMKKRYEEFGSVVKTKLGDLTKSTGTFAAGLARGETSFTSLNPIVDLVADSLGAVAKLLPVFGDGIAAGIKAAASGSKFILEQIQSAVKSFQEVSNMGGLMANGMEGLGKQLIESGMTMEGWKKVMKESATDLAALGGTVGTGMNKFSEAVGKLTMGKGPLATAGMELRKLGLTADNIGEQAAAFLQQEIRLGRGRSMTSDQLAAGTAKYVKELDLLQKVTGLSREDAQKQRDALMSDSRYRAARDQMVADGQEEGAKALDAFILTIKDPELKRGVMDLASGAGNTEAARTALTSLGGTIPEIIENLKQSTSPKDAAKRFDESQAILQESAKQAAEQWREASSLGATGLLNFATISETANGKFRTSMEEAIKIQEAQIKSTDKLTEESVEAQKQMERLAKEVQDLSFSLLKDASSAVNAFTKAMQDGIIKIKEMMGISSTPTPPGGSGQVGENASIVGGAGGEGDAAAIMNATGQSAPPAAPSDTPTSRSVGKPAASGPPGATETPTASGGGDGGPKLSRVTSKTGNSASVNEKFAGAFQGLIDYLDNSGYEIRSLGGYDPRDVRGQPGVKSIHTYGGAIDINPDKNPLGSSLVTDMPSEIGKVAASFGLGWGGNWNSKKDAMHFSAAQSEGGTLLKAKYGGIFRGPDSGFPVILHPDEAVLPGPKFEEIQKTLSTVRKESLPDLPVPSSTPNNETLMALKDLYNIFSEKLDAVVDKLSASNDIQSDLLKYSRV